MVTERAATQLRDRLLLFTTGGALAGTLLYLVETVDRIAVLRESFFSVGEIALFAAYLTPTILVGALAGAIVALVFVGLGLLRRATSSVAARWKDGASGIWGTAGAIAVLGLAGVLGVFLTRHTLLEPLHRVAIRVDTRITEIPFVLHNIGLIVTLGVVAAAAVLVLADLYLERVHAPRARLLDAAAAVASAACVLVGYRIDSRFFHGKYDATLHLPAYIGQVAAALAVGVLVVKASEATRVRRSLVLAGTAAVGFAILATGFSAVHLQSGSNLSIRALLWRRTALAVRPYKVAAALSDGDGDGYGNVLGCGDCDDRNDGVNPLAAEVGENGIDDNCIAGDAGPASTAPDPSPQPPGSARNFILISVDTLRADRMSCYGYARPTAPNLARWAGMGVFFDRAYSQGTNTGLSFASMQRSRTRGAVFDADAPTMFERLKEAGFRTTFINARRDDVWLETRRWSRYRRIILRGVDSYDHKEGEKLWNGDAVTDRAIAYLSSLGPGTRHATWIHYLDPHEPREKMAPYDYGDSESDMYDTEVAFTDREVGRLLDWLKSSGRLEDSLVVFTADHGECFLDHGAILHGNRPYDDQVWVPLMAWAPDLVPLRASEPVALLDIAPSVLGYFGLPALPGTEGRDVLRSPLVRRAIYSGTPNNLREPTFFAFGVTYGQWRYIYDVYGNTVELYDLAADPGELRNLIDRRPEVADEMRRHLGVWLDSTKPAPRK